MSLKIECNSEHVICYFSGALNTEETIKIETEVFNAVKDAKSVYFDLKDTSYIASSFLRICGKVALHRDSSTFSIINVPENVAKILKISGLYNVFNVKEL
ncbi:MAG TPA: STAS domain-containing protein [Victivallales bacterium]|nr:STAS domain-containing protein [Victivallales bacterium]